MEIVVETCRHLIGEAFSFVLSAVAIYWYWYMLCNELVG